MNTVFAKMRDGEIPVEFLHNDDEIFAVRDIAPQSAVHILVIPKKDIPGINDCGEQDIELLGKMIVVAKNLAARHSINESGYRLVVNCGKNAGQSVDQLHLHLLGGEPLDGNFGTHKT